MTLVFFYAASKWRLKVVELDGPIFQKLMYLFLIRSSVDFQCVSLILASEDVIILIKYNVDIATVWNFLITNGVSSVDKRKIDSLGEFNTLFYFWKLTYCW